MWEQTGEQEEPLFALASGMTIPGPPGEAGRGPLAAGAKTRQELCSESTMAGRPAQTQILGFLQSRARGWELGHPSHCALRASPGVRGGSQCAMGDWAGGKWLL